MAKEYKENVLDGTNAARRGYVDRLIVPEETRQQLCYAFEMLYSKVQSPSKKRGTK